MFGEGGCVPNNVRQFMIIADKWWLIPHDGLDVEEVGRSVSFLNGDGKGCGTWVQLAADLGEGNG